MAWTLILLFTVSLGSAFAPSTSAQNFTSEKSCRSAQLDAVQLAEDHRREADHQTRKVAQRAAPKRKAA